MRLINAILYVFFRSKDYSALVGKGGNGIYFMILALSFLVPDAIVSEPITVPYIETVERITDSAYAIAGQPVKVNGTLDYG